MPLRRAGRLIRFSLVGNRSPAQRFDEVGRVRRIVWPGDLDELRHVNNGAYLTLLDHARLELMVRSGTWARLRAARVYPVVTDQTISYRRSLTLGQRYEIETRVAGFDDRAVYLEQRFVVAGEVYARAYVRGRFLYEKGGVVPIEEVAELCGIELAAHPVPDWMREWAARVALPSTRRPAPSEWD